MKYLFLPIAMMLLPGIQSYARNVAIHNDGSDPDPSAALDVKVSDKGGLIPRGYFNDLPVSPATELLVYITTNGPDGNNAFYFLVESNGIDLTIAASVPYDIFKN